MKDFISKKPYLFTLLIIGACSCLFSIIQIIVAAVSKMTFYTVFGSFSLIFMVAIFLLAYIFRKITKKE